MATFLSVHDMKTIRASTVQDGNGCSPHITFEFEGDSFDARTSVTVYLPNPKFNQRLIDLINEIADDWQHVEVAPVVEDTADVIKF